jgi:hypothetical protein
MERGWNGILTNTTPVLYPQALFKWLKQGVNLARIFGKLSQFTRNFLLKTIPLAWMYYLEEAINNLMVKYG